MTSENEALRKRVAIRVEALDTVPDTSEIIDIVMAFAAEREAIAREVAIAECAKVCRDFPENFNAMYAKSHGQMAVQGVKACESCAEAISRLAAERKD